MNDPVTNVEIEDVLSSIRRLVSENARSDNANGDTAPEVNSVAQDEAAKTLEALAMVTADVVAEDVRAEEGAAMAAADPGAPDVGNMLVLTADHRIGDAKPDTNSEEALGAPPEESHHWGDDGAETALEEAAEQMQLEAVFQDAIDDAIEGVVFEAVQEPETVEDEIELVEVDLDLEPGQERLENNSEVLTFFHSEPQFADEENAALVDRIAELEAVVGERDDQWEPDGDGDEGDNAGAPVEAMNWEDSDSVETAGHEHVWESDPLDQVEEAKVVEETAAAEPEPEPESAPEPDPEPEMAADPQLAQNLDPDPGLFAESDAVIDEDTLREMVAEIVRRELQGSLGERITRNVRKLVRREIHRALAARELD